MKKIQFTAKEKSDIFIIVLGILIIVVGFIDSLMMDKFDGPYTQYDCDVKNFKLSTTIDIKKEDEEFMQVKGNIFALITDPLTLYNGEQKTAYAGDAYHFIEQDSHTIYVNDEFSAEMVGLIDFFGETYEIYDYDGNIVAKVSCNSFNTKGKLCDGEGNVLADFYSKLFYNDFTIRISENCPFDDKTVLMIFCSYYSDQNADK